MIINPVFREKKRLWLQQSKNVLGNWNTLPLKTALFLISTLALIAPGAAVRAEIVLGIIETYNPQTREATISLGEQDGVGKYDRGKIELTSLDNPNVRFVGANIVVTKVEKNFAVVSVREAPGVPVPIEPGARISLDTDSGIARREEEAKIIAAQQAEEARRQQQLEAAKAEKARRQRELEEARTAEARRQREQEEARILEARRQEEAAQAARRQQELEEVRAAEIRRQQEEAQAAQNQQESSTAPEVAELEPDLEEAKQFWQREDEGAPQATASDLPLDYLQAYSNARQQPSPETYYRFAQVLIDYEIEEQALNWLEETRSQFPETTAVNDLYRATLLIQQGKLAKGEKVLAAVNLPDSSFTSEFRSYIATQQGDWEQILAIAKPEKSAATYNNFLIARYCNQPFIFDRETDLSPKPCPFGEATPEPANSEIAEDEKPEKEELERLAALRAENREQVRQIGEQALAAYPEDPYILNTLGFIALQAEDYQQAFQHYEQLASILDRYDVTPPRLQLIKANAIEYVNNYNQNYEFLAENGEDLESLRSSQNSLGRAVLIGGAGTAISSALSNDVSPVGLAAGLVSTLLRFNQTRTRVKDIAKESNSIADQMHNTFTKDIDLLPTPPDLTADSLLKLTNKPVQPRQINQPSNNSQDNSAPTEPQASEEPLDPEAARIEDKMRQFDEFWQKSQ
ncbi:MAG: hypothetical protein AAFQ80_00970 [Cyanobacteria bacterium J06621_8]